MWKKGMLVSLKLNANSVSMRPFSRPFYRVNFKDNRYYIIDDIGVIYLLAREYSESTFELLSDVYFYETDN